jgi:hypothetical protein
MPMVVIVQCVFFLFVGTMNFAEHTGIRHSYSVENWIVCIPVSVS